MAPADFSSAMRCAVQPLGLAKRPRIAVEDVAALNVRLRKPRTHHIVHHLVRDKLALVHQTLGSFTEIGPARDIVAQDIAGRDLGDAEVSHQELSLGSLSDAGSSQKENRPGQKASLPGPESVQIQRSKFPISYQLLRPRIRPLLGVKPS